MQLFRSNFLRENKTIDVEKKEMKKLEDGKVRRRKTEEEEEEVKNEEEEAKENEEGREKRQEEEQEGENKKKKGDMYQKIKTLFCIP